MNDINKILEEDYTPAFLEAMKQPLHFDKFGPSTPPVKKPWHLRAKQRLYNKTYRGRLKLASWIAGFDVEDGGYY